MYFEENLTYHIFNQGNNRQTVFFQQRNYLFFISKMREYLLPHANILCYCLMPNHFHILLNVHTIDIANPVRDLKYNGESKIRSLNDSISILLRSYTRAINIQENRTGSLFRSRTKAKNGIIDELVTAYGEYKDLLFSGELGHVAQCFQYIHNNPVKAGLVNRAEEWQYSSALDYAELRNGTLCNKMLAKQMGLC
jgi:putative transposase